MPRSHRGFNTLKVLDSRGGPLQERGSGQAKAEGEGRVAIERVGEGGEIFWNLEPRFNPNHDGSPLQGRSQL